MWFKYYPLTFVTLLLVQKEQTDGAECNTGSIVNVEATTSPQTLTSPNYPNGYFNLELCRWQIRVSDTTLEVVRFQIRNTIIRDSATCGEDFLEVRDGPNAWSRIIRRWCGEQPLVPEVTSTDGYIFVTFRSDGKFTDAGFEMVFWTVPKGVVRLQSVQLKTVNYILFVLFGLQVLMIVLGLGIAVLVRRKGRKKNEQKQKDSNVEVFIDNTHPTKSPQFGNGVHKEHSCDSKTRVIKLEPALGSVDCKETVTTPV